MDRKQAAGIDRFSELPNYAAALILFIAACLKFAAFDFAALQPMLLVLSLIEFCFATWLISGWQSSISRKAAIVLFLFFCIFGMTRSAAGHETCACFGEVAMSPLVSALLSFMTFSCLLINEVFVANATTKAARTNWATILASTIIVSWVAAFTFTVYSAPASYVADSQMHRWIGDDIGNVIPEVRDKLPHGGNLVIGNSNCTACMKRIRSLIANRHKDENNGLVRSYFIDLAFLPDDGTVAELIPHFTLIDLTLAEKSDLTRYMRIIPTCVNFRDGKVVGIHRL